MLRKILLLLSCGLFANSAYSQDVRNYLAEGRLDSIYMHIRKQCIDDSTAFRIIERQYIIKAPDNTNGTLDAIKDVKQYMKSNGGYYCILKRYHRLKQLP